MQLSENGRNLIKQFEGLMLTAYPDPKLPKVNGQWDPKQLWSIGYGHQLPPGKVWEGHTITRAQAEQYFIDDARTRELAVSNLAPTTVPHEFDAMVSLTYNIGIGGKKADGTLTGFTGSTVRRLHNAGDKQGAADAFRMWNKSAGAVNQTLVARREKERSIYLHGYGAGSYSPPPQSVPTPPPAPPVASASSAPDSGWVSPGLPGWPPSMTVPTKAGPIALVSIAAVAIAWLLQRLSH